MDFWFAQVNFFYFKSFQLQKNSYWYLFLLVVFFAMRKLDHREHNQIYIICRKSISGYSKEAMVTEMTIKLLADLR